MSCPECASNRKPKLIGLGIFVAIAVVVVLAASNRPSAAPGAQPAVTSK